MIQEQDRTLAFLMASLVTAYPGPDFRENIQTLLEDEDLDSQCGGSNPMPWKKLRAALQVCIESAKDSDGAVEALGSEYIDLFDRGREANPLYETEYGRNRTIGKSTQLVDIAGFYRAFGLELDIDNGVHEMLDHVSVESEFYALLLMKQAKQIEEGNREGSEIILDARKKFLKDHLGRFVSAIFARPAVSAHPFYSLVFDWAAGLVAEECQRLNVSPEITGWESGQLESLESGESGNEQMSCGGQISCEGMPNSC